MSGFYGVAPTPPKLSEFWRATLEHLDSLAVQNLLGGAGRVFLITDDDSGVAQGAEEEAWGRGVVAPVRKTWGPSAGNAGRFRMVPFLVRFDVHPPGGAKTGTGANKYDPMIMLEAAHEEAFDLLHGWTPVGLTQASLDRPVWRYTDTQSAPLWDDDQGVWFLSAEYRVWLAPA